MMKWSWLLFALTVFAGCQRDVEVPEAKSVQDKIPDPTPHELRIPQGFGDYYRNPDNPLTLEGIALGKKLFHDPILSDGNKQSCASCHVQSKGFSDARKVSPGVAPGAIGTRNAMALINLAWRREFFWDGRSFSLEHQALDPVANPIEMNLPWPQAVQKLKAHDEYPLLFERAFGVEDFDSTHVVKAIAQFEKTLISADSKYDKYLRGEATLTDQERFGMDLFMSEEADCFHCHNGVTFTDNSFRNNGLQETVNDSGLGAVDGNPRDVAKFKVVTLRNIGFTAPYMHDGRFQTLEQVINFYSDSVNQQSPNIDPVMLKSNRVNGSLNLTDEEKEALIAFLNTLNDTSFIENERLSSPFE